MKAGLIKYSLLERNIEEILIHDNVVVTLGNEVTVPTDNADGRAKTIRRYTNIWVRKIMNGSCFRGMQVISAMMKSKRFMNMI
jgi:hypothetical protein